MAKLSLKDIQPKIITLEINNAELGTRMEVDMKLPTMQEWQDSYMSVEFPSPPIRQRMKNGQKEDYVDTQDPEYLRLREKASELLAMRRVTQALLGADNFTEELGDLPLEDAAEKLFETGDRALLTAVNVALARAMSATKGGVDAKKQSFREQSRDTSDYADSNGSGQGLELVEKPV